MSGTVRIKLFQLLMPYSSPALMGILRSTMERLEQRIDLDPDDPNLRHFKKSLLLAIAELEEQKSTRFFPESVTVLRVRQPQPGS